MRVIPAINEPTFEKVKEKIFLARDFGVSRIHIDVTDGKFTPHQTWNNIKDLTNLKFIDHNFDLKLGAHLMVENPDEVLDEWLNAGMHSMVLQFESIKNMELVMQKCAKANTDFILAVNPDTPVEALGDLNRFKNIQLLAVDPGAAGQEFQPIIFEKIKKLRKLGFAGRIIIDGGVTPEIARQSKVSGADVVVSASFIWNSPSPAKAFSELLAI